VVNLLGRERQFDFQVVRAAHHAFEVLRQPEGPAVENPHRLEKPVAIQEAPVIDRDDGLRLGHELSVQKDNHAVFTTKRRPFPLAENRRTHQNITKPEIAPSNLIILG
jgi:hypothetical protein